MLATVSVRGIHKEDVKIIKALLLKKVLPLNENNGIFQEADFVVDRYLEEAGIRLFIVDVSYEMSVFGERENGDREAYKRI